MPGLLRKLIVVAAVDGLILQPHGNGQRNGSNGACAIQIEYRTRKISLLPPSSPASPGRREKKEGGLESHGIVGKCLNPPGERRGAHSRHFAVRARSLKDTYAKL